MNDHDAKFLGRSLALRDALYEHRKPGQQGVPLGHQADGISQRRGVGQAGAITARNRPEHAQRIPEDNGRHTRVGRSTGSHCG